MAEIPKINRPSVPAEGTSGETSEAKNAVPGGISDSPNQVSPASSNLFSDAQDIQSIRQTIMDARAESKLPLTENYLNRFITDHLQQSRQEASQDLKGFLLKNFHLTPIQQQEISSISEQDLKLAQENIAQAEKLNLPVNVRILDLSSGETNKQLTLLREEETKEALKEEAPKIDLAWGKIKEGLGDDARLTEIAEALNAAEKKMIE